MENKFSSHRPLSELIDLSLWSEFREGLSSLLDVSISLYDEKGVLLGPATSKTLKVSGVAREMHTVYYPDAIAKTLEKNHIHIFKCRTNKYIFAVPVSLEGGADLVVVGDGLVLPKDEAWGDGDSVAESIFAVPHIVRNMAVPFLKSLYSNGLCEKSGPVCDTRQRVDSLNSLHEVCASIAPVLDRQSLYDTILEKSTELLGAERGTLMVLDNNLLVIKASRGIDRTVVEGVRVKVGEKISGAVAKKGVPVVIRDIEREFPAVESRKCYKTKSFVSIPLKMGSRVIGVINVADKLTGEVFSEDDLNLLLSFTNYASIVLERETYYSMSEELKTISMTDQLTSLFNRRYFLQRLFEESERVRRNNGCFSLFVIDVDDFKPLNDEYGHLAGDDALKETAAVISEEVRAIDVVARIGGEEFSVILPGTARDDAAVIAERIRGAVEGLKFDAKRFSPDTRLTVSIGLAEFPYDADNLEDLIHNADKAMYEAKGMGKNRVVGYEG